MVKEPQFIVGSHSILNPSVNYLIVNYWVIRQRHSGLDLNGVGFSNPHNTITKVYEVSSNLSTMVKCIKTKKCPTEDFLVPISFGFKLFP